jgi:hypothetical protein
MIRLLLGLSAAIAILCTSQTHAQLAASLQISKKQYLAGEPVIAIVTVTNHAGRELVFQSDGRFQWLDFSIKDSNGNTVNPKGRQIFGPMKIGAGQTLAREVDLTQHFQLTEPGNFSAVAIIHPPGDTSEGNSTNRIFFSQSPGRPYWTQKVGIPGKSGQTREYRILNFSGDSKSQIYAQIIDGRTGVSVRTFLLGDVLMLRKPSATIDRNQRLHVMFLTTPSMWAHYEIDTDGRVINRQIHQRADIGDPKLLTMGDGSVRVGNSIPYDIKAAQEERKKTRKASDRPAVTY